MIHTYHSLQNPECWQKPNPGVDVEQHCWWECKSGTAALEDSWAVSYKTQYIFTILSSNHACWYLPEGLRNLTTTQK